MSFQAVVWWHFSHCSTRAFGCRAIIFDIISKCIMEWLGGGRWHSAQSVELGAGWR
jgi:hypothetical protein